MTKPLGDERGFEACHCLVVVVTPDDIVTGDQATQQLVQVRDTAETAVFDWRPDRFSLRYSNLNGARPPYSSSDSPLQ